jgi:hypothetical protein
MASFFLPVIVTRACVMDSVMDHIEWKKGRIQYLGWHRSAPNKGASEGRGIQYMFIQYVFPPCMRFSIDGISRWGASKAAGYNMWHI